MPSCPTTGRRPPGKQTGLALFENVIGAFNLINAISLTKVFPL